MDSLRSCLSALSSDVRLRIASHHGLREGAIGPLVERLTNPSYLREVYKGLSNVEKNALLEVLFHGGEGFFHHSILCREQHQLTPSQLRLGLTRLRQMGLLFAQKAAWGEPHYFCPWDLFSAWHFALIDPPHLSPIKEVHSVPETPNGIGHDLFHFLICVDRERVPLTSTGQIYKRMLKRIDLELEIDSKWLADTIWGKKEIPSSVVLVMDLAAEFRLTQEENGELVIDPERVASWLGLGWKEIIHLLFSWTKKKLLARRPTWYTLWWIMEQQTEGWVRLTETVAAWSEVSSRWNRKGEISLEKVLRQLIRPLCGLGWIDMGESKEEILWRWRIPAPCIKAPLFSEGGYVKADFEVLLPAYYPLDQRWMLAQFADYAGGEQMHVYLLSAKSIARGKVRGMDEQEMIAVLEKLSLTPIPQNVSDGILQWGNRHRRIHCREVVVMEGKMGAELAQHPEIKKHVEKIGHTRFLVEKNIAEQLTIKLHNEGYTVNWAGKEEKPLWKRETSLSEMKWMPNEYVPKVVDEYPDLETAIPGISGLPQIWKASLRSYHRATMRDMIRKATQFQLDLLIEQTDRSPALFTPIKINNVNGLWVVEGRDEAGEVERLHLEKIKRLQIVVPTGK